MSLFTNITVAVQRCYIIIAVIKTFDIFGKTSGMKLVKLGNECQQLY